MGREYGKLTMAMFSSLRKLIRPSNTGLLEFIIIYLLSYPDFPSFILLLPLYYPPTETQAQSESWRGGGQHGPSVGAGTTWTATGYKRRRQFDAWLTCSDLPHHTGNYSWSGSGNLRVTSPPKPRTACGRTVAPPPTGPDAGDFETLVADGEIYLTPWG